MKVHLEGMGVVGCMLALRLEEEKIKFTWFDNYTKYNAWRASTGCIYPSGDIKEREAYHRWRKDFNSEKFGKTLERAAYWFITKNPPHGGKYDIEGHVGPLNLGGFPSYHLNVQDFVRETRKKFEDRYVDDAPVTASKLVISHGFHKKTLDHYQWGWSARVKLRFSEKITEMSDGLRPCFYLRRGRVTPLVYAMPMAGTNDWYAGSYMLNTKNTDKSYNIVDKAQTWVRNVEHLTEDKVEVIDVDDHEEGWRPCPRPKLFGNSKLAAVDDKHTNKIYVRPMEGNGVRMAPLYVDELLRLIVA